MESQENSPFDRVLEGLERLIFFFILPKKLGKENVLYLNFEDARIKNIQFSDFLKTVREYYGNKKVVLLLDEIQEIQYWDRWLRTLNDFTNFFVYASGSSSKLSWEISLID